MDKRGAQMNILGIILVIVLAVAILNPSVVQNFLGKKQATAEVKEPSGATLGTVEVVGKCGQAVTLTNDMIARYTESTSMTAQNATIVVNGGAPSTKSHGGTLTVAEGDKVEIYYALDPAQTSYGAAKAVGVIPNCKPAVKTSDNTIFSPVDAHKVYATSSTVSVGKTNLKDYSVNPTSALAIAAGGRETVRVTLTWPYKEGYGTVDGSTLACRFTDANIDQENTVAVLDGNNLGSAKYTPSNTIFALSAVNQSAKYWAFPAIDGYTKTSSILDLIIAGDSNQQPVGETNFSCAIKDTDYYQHNDGSFKIGVEDADDNSEIGRSTTNEVAFNILLS